MRLSELAFLFNTSCAQDAEWSGVSIDSRRIAPGQVFVAIQGERFDGHQFIQDAVKNGALAVICSKAVAEVSTPQFVVQDTIQALATLAAHHRRSLDCAIVALTGSNGKTSVKEMIAAILPDPSFATPGNLNNHIGAPLSVLQLQPEHRYAVFELGANHLGEIAHTVGVVQPQVALINNIAPAHIDGFGSIEGVARAKGEIYEGLTQYGTAVINDDDAYAHFWDPLLTDKQTIRFSVTKPTTIHARDVVLNTDGCAQFTVVTPVGEAFIQLTVPGMHNVSNALAAVACTHALGLGLPAIQKGLSRFSGVPGRMTHLTGKQQACIIDDTYNANLRSVLMALDVLAAKPGVRVFVFGDMGELGSWSEQHHHEAGLYARSKGIDRLMTCGTQSLTAARAFGEGAQHYDCQTTLVADLLGALDANTTVLVKGSRSSAMEKIVKELI